MQIRTALAGNPNAGKTTLFNGLTGARQHVGNYPGVTVEKKEGLYVNDDCKLHIVDLPGTYSLTAYSQEEVVARDFLVDEKPEVVINIVDASNLERNLYLTVQFLEIGVPVCIALNMIDVAKERGVKIDAGKLAVLLDVPVVPTIARTGEGKKDLVDTAILIANRKRKPVPLEISYGDDIDNALKEIELLIEKNDFLTDKYPSRWIALKYLEHDEQILSKGRIKNLDLSNNIEIIVNKVSDHMQETLNTYPEAMIADYRYGYIKSILKQGVIHRKYDTNRLYTSDRIDKVLTNRLLGPVIMLLVLFGLYQFTFTYGEIPMGWFEFFFDWLGDLVSAVLPDGHLKSLVVSGVIDGVGGVLGFVPLIMFMFFGIAILEDTGYLARVAYMLDRIFRIFGLHGSSVMAYIVSGGIAGGCAVPGIMATRTLKSRRERIATILTAPFMNCGAKLPIMALLIGAFFSKNQAMLMFLVTIASWVAALLVAKLLRLTLIRGDSTPFVMELPPYRLPTFNGLMIHTCERTWQYIKKAGTVILGISILLWAMMTFPELQDLKINNFNLERQKIMAEFPSAVLEELNNTNEKTKISAKAEILNKQLELINFKQAEASLKNSIAGRMGVAMEKVTSISGFDWRTDIALLGGFAAKEVVVSTLGTAYSLGQVDSEDSGSLAEILAKDPSWSPLVALSMIIFTILYSPCFVTVVVIAKETGSWKWAAFSMVFNTLLAFTLSALVFQAGSYMHIMTS